MSVILFLHSYFSNPISAVFLQYIWSLASDPVTRIIMNLSKKRIQDKVLLTHRFCYIKMQRQTLAARGGEVVILLYKD